MIHFVTVIHSKISDNHTLIWTIWFKFDYYWRNNTMLIIIQRAAINGDLFFSTNNGDPNESINFFWINCDKTHSFNLEIHHSLNFLEISQSCFQLIVQIFKCIIIFWKNYLNCPKLNVVVLSKFHLTHWKSTKNQTWTLRATNNIDVKSTQFH